MSKSSLLIACIIAASSALMAQEPEGILQRVNEDGSRVKIDAPEALAKRLALPDSTEVAAQEPERQASSATARGAGFRVQVFSDNNRRTAKGEAREKASAISQAFPQYETYVTYDSPFWRLRVGDFRTRDDAQRAANEIKRAFPNYAREITVVRDMVKVK